VDEQQITVDGQQIAFAQSEGAERPVIFVHGNSSSARTWGPVLAGPFGQRFRCLALDLPGHGESARAASPADYSLPGYATALTGFAHPRRSPPCSSSSSPTSADPARSVHDAGQVGEVGLVEGRGEGLPQELVVALAGLPDQRLAAGS
jgi:pimeloyl-ACP methyl ester carboxylesterase